MKNIFSLFLNNNLKAINTKSIGCKYQKFKLNILTLIRIISWQYDIQCRMPPATNAVILQQILIETELICVILFLKKKS